MTPFQKYFTSIALVLSACSPLLAQKLLPVQCRFVALDKAPQPMLNIADQANEIGVKMPTNRFSEVFECFSVEGKLTFLDQGTREEVATTMIPANIKQAVLIFLPGENGKWKIYPFEDTLKEFPAGGTRVVNLHASDIRFIIGPANEILKPRQSKGFPMPAERDDFNMAPVKFQFKNNKEEWVNGKSSAYRFLPNTRYLLLAYVDPKTQRPRVKTFKDGVRRPVAKQ